MESGTVTPLRSAQPPAAGSEAGALVVSGRHYAGIFLLSFATLRLELSLSRVFSVSLWYHFGFLVISTALLGFGVAGVVLSLWQGLRAHRAPDRVAGIFSVLFALVTVACFWTLQRIPFDPFSLLADRRQLLLMAAYYLLAAAPFFLAGLAIALLLTRGTRHVHRLYAWDLLGAGAGCLALVATMPAFGGSGSVVAAAVVGALAGAFFAGGGAPPVATLATALGLVLFALAPRADRLLPISTPNKRQRPTAPIYTAWNTFSRVDVYESPPAPERDLPGARSLVIDAGTAATGCSTCAPECARSWRAAKTTPTATAASPIWTRTRRTSSLPSAAAARCSRRHRSSRRAPSTTSTRST